MSYSHISPEFSDKIRRIVEGIVVIGRDAGGEVSVEINGACMITRVNIHESLLRPSEKQVLEGLLVAAYADAHAKLQTELTEKISGLPEIFNN